MRFLQLLVLSTALLGLLLFTHLRTNAQGETGIIVNNADDVLTITTTLNKTSPTIDLRILLEVADKMRWHPLVTPPVALGNNLATMETRILLEAVDRVRHTRLTIPSEAIMGALAVSEARILIETADKNRLRTLVYPRELINDTTAPIVSGAVLEVVNGQTNLKWSTNEFTRCLLKYGSSPATYTATIDVPEYRGSFQTQVNDLQEGVVYYYQLTCTDLSGNVTTTPEQTFQLTVKKLIYLPLVRR